MIRHIVFFTARDRAELEIMRGHLSRLGEIPHVRNFEVGVNLKLDPLGDSVDLVVYGEFDDERALSAYKAHSVYAETTTLVRPMRDLRLSADFQSAA